MTDQPPPAVTGVTPYVSVQDAAAAAEFYKTAFAATEALRMPPMTASA